MGLKSGDSASDEGKEGKAEAKHFDEMIFGGVCASAARRTPPTILSTTIRPCSPYSVVTASFATGLLIIAPLLNISSAVVDQMRRPAIPPFARWIHPSATAKRPGMVVSGRHWEGIPQFSSWILFARS